MENSVQLQRIEAIIAAMESNTFLLPNGYSEVIQMAESELRYRTYVGTRKSSGRRYINVEIYVGTDVVLLIAFEGENVKLTQSALQPYNLGYVHQVLELIYKEKHSFENHAEGMRNLRKQIVEERAKIKACEERIADFEQQIEGLKELKKEQKQGKK